MDWWGWVTLGVMGAALVVVALYAVLRKPADIDRSQLSGSERKRLEQEKETERKARAQAERVAKELEAELRKLAAAKRNTLEELSARKRKELEELAGDPDALIARLDAIVGRARRETEASKD